jgi:hypothetical protein
MAKSFLTPIKPLSLPEDPNGVEGTMYYNSTSKTMRYYNGTDWLDMSAPTALVQHHHSAVDGYIDSIPFPFLYTTEDIEIYNGGSASDTVFYAIVSGGNAR